ncbi:hypothetical protein [Pyrodictium abyssi]|uniref:Uncharacterized protein n=1 Tax=Pyrodictium abyssi TaxID=54256 RepID=A0ABM8IWT6_9CREN|nr:hypothetical protein PABY_00680 [Pyrodictium abyssi]
MQQGPRSTAAPAFGLREAGPLGVIGAAGLAVSAAGNTLSGSAMGAATLGWLFTSLASDALAHRLGERRILYMMAASGLLWLAGMAALRVAVKSPGPSALAAALLLVAVSGVTRSRAIAASSILAERASTVASLAWLVSGLLGPMLLLAYHIAASKTLLAATALVLSAGPLAEELFWAKTSLQR